MIQVFRLFLVLIAFVGGFAVRTWWPAQQFSLPPLLISILPVILFLAFAVFGQLFLLFRGKEEDTGFTGSLLLVAFAWLAMGVSSSHDGFVRVLPVILALSLARAGGARASLITAWLFFAFSETLLFAPVLEKLHSFVVMFFPAQDFLMRVSSLLKETLTEELALSFVVMLSLLLFRIPQQTAVVIAPRQMQEVKTKSKVEIEDFPEEPVPRKKKSRDDDKSGIDVATIETSEAIVVRKEQDELNEVIGTMLFFLSKNFRSYSSLGFLSSDGGKSFRLAAVISQASDKVLQGVELFHNQGLVGKSSQRPGGLCTGNVKSCNDPVEYYSERHLINSLMVSRIVDAESEELLGLLVVDSQMRDCFFQEHKALLDRFSLIASRLISNVKLSQRLKRLSWRNERAYEMARFFSKQNETNAILKGLIASYPATFDADRLLMFDQVGEKVRLFFAKGGDSFKVGSTYDLSEEGIVQEVFRTGESFLGNSVATRGRFSSNDHHTLPIQSVLAAPLVGDEGAVIAIALIEKDEVGFFGSDALQLLETLNANASTALSKAKNLEMLERLAATDGLTGIANHRQFQVLLDQSLARRRRDGLSLALVLIDIDHFKYFNDQYGHQLGDAVLKKVAEVLRRTVRTGDTAARYGGEEFVVVLETAGDEEAYALANRIREAVEAVKIPYEDRELNVTISAGISIFPHDASEKNELIERADQALYASKEAGRNRVTSYRTIRDSLPDKGEESSSFLEKNG